MKVDQFKAWFEGFTEGLVGTPSPAQWERIKQRILEIDGTNTVYIPSYINNHYPSWHRDHYMTPYCSGVSGGAQGEIQSFNTGEMKLLGKAEFLAE